MATVVTATPTAVPDGNELHLMIKYDREQYQTRFPLNESIKQYRDYRGGKHSLQLTAEAIKILEGLTEHQFCDNLAHKVTADARDRVRFLRWECSDNETTNEYLKQLYKLNSLLERMPKTVYETLGDGDYALALGWSNKKKRVTIHREPWWDGIRGLYIGYDNQDEPVYACKDWEEQTFTNAGIGLPVQRRNIWFENRLERWASEDGGNTWHTYLLPEDKGQWPVFWTENKQENGVPLEIPYVHLRNSGRGEDVYGTSIISATLGMIDQVQDLHYTLSGAARMNGFPIITGTGVELEPDPENSGDFKELEIRCGALLRSGNKDARFGSIPANDPKGQIETLMVKKQSLSTVTQTPLHYLTGNWPSGEALMRAEQPAVGQADTQVATLQRAMVEVAVKAIKLENQFGTGPKIVGDIEKAMITAVFAPTERRDPLSQSVIVANLGDRLSDQNAFRIMGYGEEWIIKNEAEKNAAAEADVTRQNKLFSRGVGRGTNLPGRGPAAGEEDTTANAPAQDVKPGNAEKK